MSKKNPFIGFEKGHSNTDSGAVSDKSGKRVCERDETEDVGARVVKILRDRGIKVLTDPPENKGFDFVEKSNRAGVDLYVSLHFNAGGGDGAEAYVYDEKRRPLGDAFKKPMAKIGQGWRGTKLEPEFVVLRDTTMPAVLIEGYFVDSKDAKDWATEKGRQKMAEAVAEGCINALISLGFEVPSAKHSSGGRKPRKPQGMTLHCYDVRKGDCTDFSQSVELKLKYRGYLKKRINANSVFDEESIKALHRYQKAVSLPIKDEVDEDCASLLLAGRETGR